MSILYEKPAMGQLVVTDSPICTNHPELVKERLMEGKITNKFGTQARSIRDGYADCPCQCICQCPCQCICQSQYSVPSREEISKLVISQKALKLSNNYKFRKESSGGLLFNNVTWDTKKLNGTGLNILQFLNGELTPNGIAAELGKIYGIASELILPDVEQFLCILQSFGVAHSE